MGLLTALLYRKYEKLIIGIISASLLVLIGYFGSFLPEILQGNAIQQQINWVEVLSIHWSFHLDGLSLFFTLLISIFGLLIFWYATSYMKEYAQRNRFFGFFFLFMGSMLGLVLSSNTISLFVFWELTSLSSFLLIGFTHEKDSSRKAARQALLVTAGGGLALMAGFILLEAMTQTGFNLQEALSSAQTIKTHGLMEATILLVALGAFTKSAQFPFHFWLPNAMAAPTPVSAYLHSATMVKAGVYLVLRLNPLFESIALWSNLLGIVGAITMTWGAIKSFQQDDLKAVLAYTTISALGIFFLMTGVGGEAAINAVMVYLLAHALYKGALFLAVGNIDHQTGTRSISKLSDLIRKMPYTSMVVLVSFASMAGVIPFIGFVGKESLYAALYHGNGSLDTGYLVLLVVSSMFFVAVGISVTIQTLLRKGSYQHQQIAEASHWMMAPPLVLALFSLLSGVFPGVLEPLLGLSADNVQVVETSMHLKLWHGLNVVFLLSVGTLIAGAALFFIRKPLQKFRKPQWLTGNFLYQQLMDGTSILSKRVTITLQNGYLSNYIATVLLIFCGLIVWLFVEDHQLVSIDVSTWWTSTQIYELVILLFVVMAVGFLFRTRSRLIVTATFGIVGYSMALAYTLFSAPDVAITQFLAETLTLMLMILILHQLPAYTLKKRINHWKYLPVAIVFGLLMMVITYTMLEYESQSALKQYFLEQSVSAGKGANAVNVILVDFRALDTLGEITVLTITMLGIVALLGLKTANNQK